MPELPAKDAESDFYFIDRAEPEQIAATLVEMVKTRIPAKSRFDPIRDIQVFCPMNRGSMGIRELNVRFKTGGDDGGGHLIEKPVACQAFHVLPRMVRERGSNPP